MEHEVRTGLPSGNAGTSAISVVNPETGEVTYRGHPVEELCRRHSFEEVAYLLWHGELPTRNQVFAQNRAERAQRSLDPDVAAAIAGQPFSVLPLDVLRTVVTLLGGGKEPAEPDTTPAATRSQALRLFAVLPSVISMDQRRRHGLGAVEPRDHLGYAANFLYMTFGKVPEPQIVAAFETCLILSAGQIPAASAFTAPAVSGIYGTVAARIDALKGSSHAGASEAVVEMLNEIAIPDNAKPWVEEALADERSITGFGDRRFKNGDPRVRALRVTLGMIASLRDGQDLLETYDALTAAMLEATRLHPDLDYPVGVAYRLIGFDPSTFSSICVAASLPDWTARIAGQLTAPASNRSTTGHGPAAAHHANRELTSSS